MRVTGAFEVAAPPAAVWGSLWSADGLAAWIPGCRHAEWTDGESVAAEVEQTVALLKAAFRFELRVSERREGEHLRLQGGGQAEVLNSNVSLDMSLDLAPAAAGTGVQYAVEIGISGRLATIGDFMLKAKAKELQRDLVRSVKARLERPWPAGSTNQL